MDYEIQIFKHEKFKQIRGLLIDGEPWFVGKDVARALGYKNTKDALKKHVDEEDNRLIQKSQIATLEIPNRGLTFINESGLYSLIFGSQLPEAKESKHWVTSEVLPSIRKTGSYSLNAHSDDMQNADMKTILLDMRSILLEVFNTVNSAPDMQEIFGKLSHAFQEYAQTRQKDRDIECGKILEKMLFALKDSETKEHIAKLTTNLLLGEKVF